VQLLREPVMRMHPEGANQYGDRRAEPAAARPRYQTPMRYQWHPVRITVICHTRIRSSYDLFLVRRETFPIGPFARFLRFSVVSPFVRDLD
jgi:hypothetical protein